MQNQSSSIEKCDGIRQGRNESAFREIRLVHFEDLLNGFTARGDILGLGCGVQFLGQSKEVHGAHILAIAEHGVL